MSYILLVEDDPNNAQLMTRLLHTLHLEVRHTTRGLQGAEWARHERPLLILMDINLPDIDGRAIVMMLKKHLGGAAAPPIVAVTAREGAYEADLAARYGCSAFIKKPFKPEEFLTTVKGLLPPATTESTEQPQTPLADR